MNFQPVQQSLRCGFIQKSCKKFGINLSSDFRFTWGANHGLGSIYVYMDGVMKTKFPDLGFNKFSDKGGKTIKGNLIYYTEPDAAANAQEDWFAPNKAPGLTQTGLLRINQSIKAFVYCILGAQVNEHSSILGQGGWAKQAKSEFQVLVEDAIT